VPNLVALCTFEGVRRNAGVLAGLSVSLAVLGGCATRQAAQPVASASNGAVSTSTSSTRLPGSISETGPSSTSPYVPATDTTTTTTSLPHDYAYPTTTTTTISTMVYEDENWVAQEQSAVNADQTAYQNDQSNAQIQANACSRDQATVQQDLSDGTEPTADQQIAQQACTEAQSAANVVSSDEAKFQQDEANLTAAEDALQSAEQG